MKDDASEPSAYAEAAEVLKDEGLVCLPCGGSYRVVADLLAPNAVQKLFHSKRRRGSSPTLVFVHDRTALRQITDEPSPESIRLMDAFWPGPLTLLLEPQLELPNKILKKLLRVRRRIGVRMPSSSVAQEVVAAFGGPVLVSSANVEKKAGAYSAAQVRNTFFHPVDLFFDAGDLPQAPPSTVVEIVDGQPAVVRAGAISAEAIQAALAD